MDPQGTSHLAVRLASPPVTAGASIEEVTITVVGIAADGTLASGGAQALSEAEVVFGGDRQLALLPTQAGQERVRWPSPLREVLPDLLRRYAGRRLAALASGDPLVSGIGTTLVALLGAERVHILPALSSLALARARLGWAAEESTVVTLVGRDPRLVLRHLAPGQRLLVLSADEHTPDEVARLLVEAGYGASRLTVLGDLGTPHETRSQGTAATWDHPVSRLNIIAVELVGQLTTGWAPGLPDDAFDHDGQLTKRDLRASALARLMPAPGQLLWDVGAGAGSVGIEWLRAHPGCRAVAVEADPERAARIARNADRLGVPLLDVVLGRAPDALADLPAPDAVFVGGGATRPGVLEACLAALSPGGRLVVHAVTVETEAILAQRHADLGGELTRISVEQVAPVGTSTNFRGWTPQRTVTQWSYSR